MANGDLVGALVRGMDIVKLVGESPDGMRLGEIAATLKLKIPTCSNLVRTLTAGGFLEKRNMRFFSGPELLRLAGQQPGSPLEQLAEPELLLLYQRVPRGTVVFGLAGKQGIEQTFRISFERPGVIQRLNREIMHPYATAAGLIGLAFADEESFLIQNERWPFSEFGLMLWQKRAALDACLEEIRHTKIAVSPFDRDIFLRISGAILEPSGRLVAAIGASVPVSQLREGDRLRIESEVRAAAGRLSRTPGGC